MAGQQFYGGDHRIARHFQLQRYSIHELLTSYDQLSSIATDVLIIGCGAAGLSLALRLADTARVIALAKGPVYEGSTSLRPRRGVGL